ncbi:hypothetical protein BpHYR1_043430 [Brachionus plicatilis]|uniref:Uncharacterized protein n=1 Tax=Brachionus plicatilis TaxID=10195 RepID=A0A3M7R1G4_BRAPC|nr:hypothetical protein BpHYR1_043430 [Brachionus plicatilis]
MVGTNCLNQMLELIATIKAFKLRNPWTKLAIIKKIINFTIQFFERNYFQNFNKIFSANSKIIDFEKWKLKQLLDKDKKKVLINLNRSIKDQSK